MTAPGHIAAGRPTRCENEALVVRAAMSAMSASLSQRAKARNLARRVVAELLAMSERVDDWEISLAGALAVISHDPARVLACDPEVALFQELVRERSARFEARGCRQLSAAEWAAETAEITEALENRLTERFRRGQRKWA